MNNERVRTYDEKYMIRTIEAAYRSGSEEATGLAGELSAIVDSSGYRDGDTLSDADADLVDRLNAAIPPDCPAPL